MLSRPATLKSVWQVSAEAVWPRLWTHASVGDEENGASFAGSRGSCSVTRSEHRPASALNSAAKREVRVCVMPVETCSEDWLEKRNGIRCPSGSLSCEILGCLHQCCRIGQGRSHAGLQRLRSFFVKHAAKATALDRTLPKTLPVSEQDEPRFDAFWLLLHSAGRNVLSCRSSFLLRWSMFQ